MTLLLLLFAALALGGEASAGKDDLVFTEALRSSLRAKAPFGGEVRLYGPVPMSPGIRNARGFAYLYLDGVDFGGAPAEVTLFLVDASRSSQGPKIREEDYIGGVANMAGMIDGRVDLLEEINDAPAGSPGPALKGFSRLKRMSKVMVAVVVQSGRFTFDQLVISVEKRPEVGKPIDADHPAGPASRRRRAAAPMAPAGPAAEAWPRPRNLSAPRWRLVGLAAPRGRNQTTSPAGCRRQRFSPAGRTPCNVSPAARSPGRPDRPLHTWQGISHSRG